jgi:Ca2+-transporting ATPase
MTVVAGTFGAGCFSKSESESISQWASSLSPGAKSIITQSVAINSTAFEGEEEGKPTFIGSKTETALLQLARDHLGLQSLSAARSNETVMQMFPFDSGKKCMGSVVRLPNGSGYRLLVKGASEILLGYCSAISGSHFPSQDALTPVKKTEMLATIEKYASNSLRTIGLVYKDYESWPPAHAELADGHVTFASLLHDLAFIGVVGIQDPVRPGVPEAVRKAQHAGVTVRMVTGDNIVTAKAIAIECGIYTDGGVVMEGPVFRKLKEADIKAILPKLQVLARSSPEDKRILVTLLKEQGETVAVTGDGTNDAPALKAADVGFSMGISGTEVAKEASAIVLMDDNFASIVTALKWGRAVNDAVQKFLQVRALVARPPVDKTLTAPTVPNHSQHHGRPARLCHGSLRPKHEVCPQGRPTALGEPHHGHLCRPGTGHGSPNRKDARPSTPRQEGAADYHKCKSHHYHPSIFKR